MKGSWSKGATPGRSDGSDSFSNAMLTDGGLDAETVLGTVDPGDVVEVAGSPYRVVDVQEGEGEGILRLYDLVERKETVKAAGAGDVDRYVHRSEEDVIDERVREERARRDAGDEQDVDEGDGVETDGGSSYCAECNRSVAREDRVERDGDVFHRQCAPDDVVDHQTLDDLRTDGGVDCFYCSLETDGAHPTCDRPDCENLTHGHGPEGKRVLSNCPRHRSDVDRGDEIVTDGGEPVASTGGGRHAPAMDGTTTPGRCAHYCSVVETTVYAPLLECPHECADDVVADGGLDAPSREERERRARQRGIGFVVRCRRANLDPHDALDDVLEELAQVRGNDDNDDVGRGTAVLPDGGREERWRDPRGVAVAAEICVVERDYDRLEDAALELLSIARQGKQNADDGEVVTDGGR